MVSGIFTGFVSAAADNQLKMQKLAAIAM